MGDRGLEMALPLQTADTGELASNIRIPIKLYTSTPNFIYIHKGIKLCIWLSEMPVLTITSRKGGCGKTMLSMVVASSLANRNIDVALLDADPNGAAHRWATETHTGQTIKSYTEADAERLADLLPTLAQRHAALIIDTAGFGNQAAAVAIAGADLVLGAGDTGRGRLG
jgi:Mrp family chromosome partitioning ATPase